MIKSVHIIGGQALGGAELFFTRLVRALYERGNPILAITVPDSLITAELPFDLPRQHIAMRNVWDLPARWHIQKTLRQQQPDIVQTYMSRATRLTHLTAGQRPIHIARLGGYYPPRGHRHAHAWVAVSNGIADHLIQHGIPQQRIFTISNFVTPATPYLPEYLLKIRHSLAIPEDALIVVAVGRLHPVKGFNDLLNAFAQVPATLDKRPLYLLIVGNGPLAETLQNQAQQLGISERVHFTGWRDDAGAFQELADLCVCSSLQEGAANVILEAWAHGRPVLATRTLGPMEIARHGENAWLVPVCDPNALAEAMRLLLSDAALRNELAQNGYKTLLAQHSEDAIISQYLEMYQTLLAG